LAHHRIKTVNRARATYVATCLQIESSNIYLLHKLIKGSSVTSWPSLVPRLFFGAQKMRSGNETTNWPRWTLSVQVMGVATIFSPWNHCESRTQGWFCQAKFHLGCKYKWDVTACFRSAKLRDHACIEPISFSFYLVMLQRKEAIHVKDQQDSCLCFFRWYSIWHSSL